MKKIIVIALIITVNMLILSGCVQAEVESSKFNLNESNLDFTFEVDPETLELKVKANDIVETVSEALVKTKVSNLKQDEKKVAWSYDEKNIGIEIEKKKNYLDVKITNQGDEENVFSWPRVRGDAYILPLNQGKYIPSNDGVWKKYLNEMEIKGIEGFSMQFFAVEKRAYSITYIIENPYNNLIKFDTNDKIKFDFQHEYPSINKNKEYGFRIYVTPINPVDISKTYKKYLLENNKFKTLNEKAKSNSNIEKLYGASHIYFWDTSVISEENIKWAKLKGQFPSELKVWINELLDKNSEESEELSSAYEDLNNLDYVDKYTKFRIIDSLNLVLQLRDFYNPEIFTELDDESKKTIDEGIGNLNPLELINLNKKLLESALKDYVDPSERWADANSVDIIRAIKRSGMNNLWIGLDDWQEGYRKPELVEEANKQGYLIGTYDSYHSIHSFGEEKWITAKFEDSSLFENATVTAKNGEKIEGFQGVGRKLNPTLALPSVKQRVSSILDTGLKFNSWFLDTDGTGEVFDDYTPEHLTTEEEDLDARIERMTYLQENYNMVIGTEGGNDFANTSIAFAHGIETPSFSWMDKDMSKNKDSDYYVGRYYSSTGGVPEVFSKQISIKDEYKSIFLDEKYSIPLYKLVYNDSVITTYWWGWGTLKIKDEIKDRMLYEILYNVPPLYHIDKQEWRAHSREIVRHSTLWAEFSKKAIKEEMSDYKILSEDRQLQMTKYGEQLTVIANFSLEERNYNNEKIPAKSVLIIDGENMKIYTP